MPEVPREEQTGMRGFVTKKDAPHYEFIARQWNPAGPEGAVLCIDPNSGQQWVEQYDDLTLVEGQGTIEEFRAFLDVHAP